VVPRTDIRVHDGPCKFFAQAGSRLIEAVTTSVELLAPDKSGVSRLQHLEQAEKCGAKPKQLKEWRELSSQVKKCDMWLLFWDIRAGLQADMPINMTELKAYFELMGESSNPGKVRLIKQMDNAYLQARYKG
jgi:hypothetical protein